MIDRRGFLVGATAMLAACGRDGGGGSTDAAARPLGIQLYTVRDLMAEDVGATLDLVASIGYGEVELAGLFDHTPAEFRRLLDAAGLTAPSSHVQYAALAAHTESIISAAAELGHRYVTVPFLAEDQRSLDDYRRHAENFNRWGEACRVAGLRFAYHNHMFEFEETDGVIPYDLLLSETDAGLVAMQLDLAWAHGGGADAVSYFESWPGRFPMVHIKDLNDANEEVDIGDGGVHFAEIFRHVAAAGLEHGFIERDHAADVRASIRNNYDAIRPLWDDAMRTPVS